MNKEEKMANPSLNQGEVIPSQRVPDVGDVVKKGHFQRDCKQKKDGEGKGKEKDSAYVTDSNISVALVLSLAGSSESWVMIWAPPFTLLPDTKSFKIM